MDNKFNNEKPIFMQIADKIKYDIVSGKMYMGQKIPSVRELALTLGVNPNTLQKAMTYLEETKLIETKSTSGRFVTEQRCVIENAKKNIIEDIKKVYFKQMEEIGLDKNSAIEVLKEG